MGTAVDRSDTHPVPTPTDKPLNATQLKTLERLVTADFADLREQVKAEIELRLADRRKVLNAKRQEVEDKYGDDDALTEAKERVTQLVRDFEDQVAALHVELKAQGIVMKKEDRCITIVNHSYYMIQTGRQQALDVLAQEEQQLQGAAGRLTGIAFRVIGRNERATMRSVLLQGVTSTGASELVNDLPKSDDIIVEVKAELALHGEDELDILGVNEG